MWYAWALRCVGAQLQSALLCKVHVGLVVLAFLGSICVAFGSRWSSWFTMESDTDEVLRAACGSWCVGIVEWFNRAQVDLHVLAGTAAVDCCSSTAARALALQLHPLRALV
jgi:hypothetical protein